MERTIARTIQESEDISAGLQVFLDHIRRRDSNIGECIKELLMIVRGLDDLNLSVESLSRLPPQLEDDIQLLLGSLRLSLARLEQMFGETSATKLDGNIPYAHIWHDYCKDLEEHEGGMELLPRLELYSIFLKAILQWLAGKRVEKTQMSNTRTKIARLLQFQLPGSLPPTANQQATTPPYGSIPMPNLPGSFWPPVDPRFPPPSPALSTASSWQTHASAGSGGSVGPHWASFVFNGQHPCSKFPSSERKQSAILGVPLPDALKRLEQNKFHLICQLKFSHDDLTAQFWYQPTSTTSRLLLIHEPKAGKNSIPYYFCSFVTRLKLRRTATCLDLHRLDKSAQTYALWARLAFRDYERLTLFYSVFVALKDQDISTVIPANARRTDQQDSFRIDPEEDYVVLTNEEVYGGQIIFDSNRRHALRIYRDKVSGGARMEARPLRGPKRHVPIWSAFIPHPPSYFGANIAGSLGSSVAIPSVKQLSATDVEIRKMPIHTFLDGFEMPIPKRPGVLGGGGKTAAVGSGAGAVFNLKFANTDDADTFVRMVKSLLAGRGRS